MSVDYKAYTTKFDRIVPAEALGSVLGGLSVPQDQALEKAWATLSSGLLTWRTSLHLLAAEASSRVREKLTDEQRADTVVALLFDQSGSMRGQKMLFAAATADVAQEFLLTLGIRCEVLGFTTSKWRGGRSRSRWRWRWRPANPGRLNDLLHIVYKDADDLRASTGTFSLRNMLRPDLPKENIDGEAVLWAAQRLSERLETRKLLIVFSDGAPVDDSTLAANGPNYLADHLQYVVEELVRQRDLEIAALGIGYRAHDFYPVPDHVEASSELGVTTIKMLEKVLLGEPVD
jgi:cobaltochelatase CobT